MTMMTVYNVGDEIFLRDNLPEGALDYYRRGGLKPKDKLILVKISSLHRFWYIKKVGSVRSCLVHEYDITKGIKVVDLDIDDDECI